MTDGFGNPAPNVVKFGKGVAPEYRSLGLGSLLNPVACDAIRIVNYNLDVVYAQRAIERLLEGDSDFDTSGLNPAFTPRTQCTDNFRQIDAFALIA